MNNDIFIEEISKIKVYIRTDKNGNITAVNSSIFLSDLTSWIEIDEGIGDKYAHAQGNYFKKPLINDNGIYRYKYSNGVILEKTEEEIEAEISSLPKPPMTETELLKAQIKALSDENEFLSDCIIEMAQTVYA